MTGFTERKNKNKTKPCVEISAYNPPLACSSREQFRIPAISGFKYFNYSFQPFKE